MKPTFFKFALQIAISFLIFACISCEKDCDNKVRRRGINPEVSNYLQMAKGDSAKYLHYVNGTFIDTLIFVADAPYSQTNRTNTQVEAKCPVIEEREYRRYQFSKSMPIKKFIFLEIQGDYGPGLYDGDWDHTSLDVFFNDIHYSFFDFGSAVVLGKLSTSSGDITHYKTDSIISLGRNFGNGWMLQGPGLKSKIYFTRSHGIVKYENTTDDEQYYLLD